MLSGHFINLAVANMMSLTLGASGQGGQWEPYWAALEQPVREKLTIMYGL